MWLARFIYCQYFVFFADELSNSNIMSSNSIISSTSRYPSKSTSVHTLYTSNNIFFTCFSEYFTRITCCSKYFYKISYFFQHFYIFAVLQMIHLWLGGLRWSRNFFSFVVVVVVVGQV